jgi:hypothetical protein
MLDFLTELSYVEDVRTVMEAPAAANPSGAVSPAQLPFSVDAEKVLRQVFQLMQESTPELDIDARMRAALANPESEVVDSLGAVSVVCMLYGAYSPENLIPADLLTHRNLTTLNGLKNLVAELNKKQAKQ